MLRIGLTGGIASGKSTVAAELAARGAVVVDADVLAREVRRAGHAGTRRGRRALRPGASLDGERLDRAALAGSSSPTRAPAADLERHHPPPRPGPGGGASSAPPAPTPSSSTTSRCWSRPVRPTTSTSASWSTSSRRPSCGGCASATASARRRPAPGSTPRPAGPSGWPSPTGAAQRRQPRRPPRAGGGALVRARRPPRQRADPLPRRWARARCEGVCAAVAGPSSCPPRAGARAGKLSGAARRLPACVQSTTCSASWRPFTW